MARSGTRYYREVTAGVLRWYLELGSGVAIGFDDEIVNYRIDVEIAMKRLDDAERSVALSIHRDGLTAPDALRIAGVSHTRPDEYVTAVEVKLGREFERRRLEDLVHYLKNR